MSLQEKSDAQWQAESDANTLAESDVIRADEGRITSAKSAARNMAKEAEVRAESLKRIVEGTGMTEDQIRKRYPKSYKTIFPGME